MKHISNVSGLLIENLEALIDLEKKQDEALNKISRDLKNADLKKWMVDLQASHADHVKKLEDSFELFGIRPRKNNSKSINYILNDGFARAKKASDDNTADKSLICTLYKLKQFGVLNYDTARAYALGLGDKNLIKVLEKNLADEEFAKERIARMMDK